MKARTKVALARELEVTRGTLRRWELLGCPMTGSRAIRAWYRERERAKKPQPARLMERTKLAAYFAAEGWVGKPCRSCDAGPRARPLGTPRETRCATPLRVARVTQTGKVEVRCGLCSGRIFSCGMDYVPSSNRRPLR